MFQWIVSKSGMLKFLIKLAFAVLAGIFWYFYSPHLWVIIDTRGSWISMSVSHIQHQEKDITFILICSLESSRLVFCIVYRVTNFVSTNISTRMFLMNLELKDDVFAYLTSTHIVNTRNFGRSKFCVVGSTTWWVDPTTGNPLLQYCIINCKVEHLINFGSLLLKHLIELCQFKKKMIRSKKGRVQQGKDIGGKQEINII